MDCRTFNRQLEDYLQGGMDFPKRFGMERHARQCFGCGKQLSDAQRIGRMARDLKRVSAPADFEAAVMARIQTQEVRSRSWRLWNLWVFGWESFSWQSLALVSTALALAVVGGVLYFNSPQGTPKEPEVAAEGSLPLIPETPIERASEAVDVPSVRSATPSPIFLQTNDFFYDEWPVVSVDPNNEGWIEIPVPGPRGDEVIRLPKTLRMQYGQPSAEHFIRNVSH
jgi:hypothetical protein